METHGRERRNRYFTIASYRTLVAQENLDQPTVSYSVVNLNEVGGFAAIAHSAFYEDETVLFKYQDEFKEQGKTRSGGKPRKYPLKNPILSDGTVKQGRPKGSTKKAKLLALGEIGVQPTTKRKRAESDNVQQGSANDGNDGPQSSRPGKKRRFKADNVAGGFPIENGAGISIGLAVDPTDSQLDFGPPDDDEVATVENTHSETRNRPPKEGPGIASGEAGQMLTPKKRGRPPKKKPNVDNETGKGDIVMAGPDKECDVSIPKKRGDPPKRKLAALQGTAAGRLVDQLKRTEENTFPPNERDRSSHKKPAALDMKFGEYQAGVSAQFLPEGQVKKRARIEIDPPELPDHHAEVDTTTSPLLLSSERTGTPRRTAGFAHISDLDVLGSNSQFERDGLGAVHDSHRLHATTCHPRDLTATLRNEPSLRSEPVWDFVEHQPGDMGHKNADSDTSPSQARPSPIPIESSASPGLRESPILPKSFYSEFHNLQRQPDTFVTIDPSLTMGETGGANTSSSVSG
jgi:hypothetical protein